MSRIKDFIKRNDFIYRMYLFIIHFYIEIIKIFFKPKEKRILFVSYSGSKFDDSPKAIYDKMINDSYFDDYEMIWAFQNINDFKIQRGKKISFDSLAYFYYVLTSYIWITNVSIERGLKLKRNNIYINTWHGTPLKRLIDVNKYNILSFSSEIDFMCCQSEFDKNIFSKLFNVRKDHLVCCDLPRNDVLFEKVNTDKLKTKLKIPKNKKVILYMPTYREYERDKNTKIISCLSINFDKWKEQLSDEYVLLLRLHYLVEKSINIQEDNFIKLVSDYPCLNDLYLVSDMLISDYSSAYFDYSLLHKPMFNYSYDYQEYLKKRNFYLPITELPCKIHYDEDSLLDDIKHFSYVEACQKSTEFQSKYAKNGGNASLTIINYIKNLKAKG